MALKRRKQVDMPKGSSRVTSLTRGEYEIASLVRGVEESLWLVNRKRCLLNEVGVV